MSRFTELGRFLVRLRMGREELLFDMAEKLGTSSDYLSKVQEGTYPLSKKWVTILEREYNLTEEQVKFLNKYVR